MDFLNIGSGELVLLILLAILVVGPKRAVELAQQAGRFVSSLRRQWYAVQRDLTAEVEALTGSATVPSSGAAETDSRRS